MKNMFSRTKCEPKSQNAFFQRVQHSDSKKKRCALEDFSQKISKSIENYRLPSIVRQRTLDKSPSLELNSQLLNIKNLLKQKLLKESESVSLHRRIPLKETQNNSVHYLQMHSPSSDLPYRIKLKQKNYKALMKKGKEKGYGSEDRQLFSKQSSKINSAKLKENGDKVKKLHSFRVYGYAIYFCIFLSKYSKLSSKNRHAWFMEKYISNKCSLLVQRFNSVLKNLLKINLYSLWKRAESENDFMLQKKESKENRLQKFINLFIIQLYQLLSSQSFLSQNHEIISIGILDQGYILTNLYLPEQVPFLRIHAQRGYLMITEQIELTLMVMKVIVKIVIFKYLMDLKSNKAWIQKQVKIHEMTKGQGKKIFKMIKYLTAYLYIVCEQFFELSLKKNNKSSNFLQYCHKFRVRLSKPLEDDTNIEENQTEIPLLIHNLSGYSEMLSRVRKSEKLSKFKSEVTYKIMHLIQTIHAYVKQKRRTYDFVHSLQLKDSTEAKIHQQIYRRQKKQQRQNEKRKIPQQNDNKKEQTEQTYKNYLQSIQNHHKNLQKNSKYSKHLKLQQLKRHLNDQKGQNIF